MSLDKHQRHIVIQCIYIPRPSSGIQISVSKKGYDILNNVRIVEFSPNYQKQAECCCPTSPNIVRSCSSPTHHARSHQVGLLSAAPSAVIGSPCRRPLSSVVPQGSVQAPKWCCQAVSAPAYAGDSADKIFVGPAHMCQWGKDKGTVRSQVLRWHVQPQILETKVHGMVPWMQSSTMFTRHRVHQGKLFPW